jgi:hypothetical protein
MLELNWLSPYKYKKLALVLSFSGLGFPFNQDKDNF